MDRQTPSSDMQHPESTDSFPHVPPSDAGGAPSIISSRMTDIASEDGDNYQNNLQPRPTPSAGTRHSVLSSTGGSIRPGTSGTAISSQRGAPWARSPSKQGYIAGAAGQRGSLQGSTSGSSIGRPPSAASKTHVPSLTSHAFFKPMGAQRLQAQRGGQRPISIQAPTSDDGIMEGGNNMMRHSMTSSQPVGPSIDEDNEGPAPPSRGTEITEHGTFDRVTANTSPTGHYPAMSIAENVQKHQQTGMHRRSISKTKNLTLSLDKDPSPPSITTAGPQKSPRSFRSSFLLPSRSDSHRAPSPRGSNVGREKLPSAASSPGPQSLHKAIGFKNQKKASNYQYFTGNTVFCWGGRLQNTRHKPINIATGLFVVIPGALFFGFSAPWLWHHVSPAIPILFAYLFYICMSSFLHASMSDPGILPRNLHQFPPPAETDDPLTLAPPTNAWTLIKSYTSENAAMEVPTKYCKSCNLWRPPRGHHCRTCDNCVETQDHHCVWLNNCVGRRNYRYFFTFVSSGTLIAMFLLGASLAHLLVWAHQEGRTFNAAIRHWRVPFAMVLYGIIAIPYPAALMIYHVFLMSRGETTREYLNGHKFLPKDRHRPFTQGGSTLSRWTKNILVVLCRPRPPTYLGFKRRYEEGDQRFGERRGKRTAPLTKNAQGGGEGVEMVDVVKTPEQGFQGPTALRN